MTADPARTDKPEEVMPVTTFEPMPGQSAADTPVTSGTPRGDNEPLAALDPARLRELAAEDAEYLRSFADEAKWWPVADRIDALLAQLAQAEHDRDEARSHLGVDPSMERVREAHSGMPHSQTGDSRWAGAPVSDAATIRKALNDMQPIVGLTLDQMRAVQRDALAALARMEARA